MHHFSFQFAVSVLYKYELIFREVLKFKFDYCKLWNKNGTFSSENPVIALIYYAIKDTIPSIIKHACPFKKGIYNITNIRVGIESLPLNQLMPTGVYKAFVNISSKGQLWGSGWGTAEMKTPLTW